MKRPCLVPKMSHSETPCRSAVNSALADHPDVTKFDPGLQRIYAACYSEAISVFHRDDPQHYRKLEDSFAYNWVSGMTSLGRF